MSLLNITFDTIPKLRNYQPRTLQDHQNFVAEINLVV